MAAIASATDDGFPGKLERNHFHVILGGIFLLGAFLMTYWWIYD